MYDIFIASRQDVDEFALKLLVIRFEYPQKHALIRNQLSKVNS